MFIFPVGLHSFSLLTEYIKVAVKSLLVGGKKHTHTLLTLSEVSSIFDGFSMSGMADPELIDVLLDLMMDSVSTNAANGFEQLRGTANDVCIVLHTLVLTRLYKCDFNTWAWKVLSPVLVKIDGPYRLMALNSFKVNEKHMDNIRAHVEAFRADYPDIHPEAVGVL